MSYSPDGCFFWCVAGTVVEEKAFGRGLFPGRWQKQEPSEVYLQMGFEDVSHFSYVFKNNLDKVLAKLQHFHCFLKSLICSNTSCNAERSTCILTYHVGKCGSENSYMVCVSVGRFSDSKYYYNLYFRGRKRVFLMSSISFLRSAITFKSSKNRDVRDMSPVQG